MTGILASLLPRCWFRCIYCQHQRRCLPLVPCATPSSSSLSSRRDVGSTTKVSWTPALSPWLSLVLMPPLPSPLTPALSRPLHPSAAAVHHPCSLPRRGSSVSRGRAAQRGILTPLLVSAVGIPTASGDVGRGAGWPHRDGSGPPGSAWGGERRMGPELEVGRMGAVEVRLAPHLSPHLQEAWIPGSHCS